MSQPRLRELIAQQKGQQVVKSAPQPKALEKAKTAKAVAKAKKDDQRRRRFALLWLRNDCNAAAAYREMSPKVTAKTAAVEGCKILNHPDTQRYVSALTKQLHDDQKLEADFIIGKWIQHANANVMDYLDYDEETKSLKLKNLSQLPVGMQQNLRKLKIKRTVVVGDEGEEAAINEDVQFELVDPQKAVDSMARAAHMLTDKVEVTHRFDAADMVEKGVARMRELGRLEGGNLYDEEGNLIEEGA